MNFTDIPVCFVLFFLQMIQAIRTVVENTDNLYEKIVQCQKAGKYKLYFKNVIRKLQFISEKFSLSLFVQLYKKNLEQPKTQPNLTSEDYCNFGMNNNSEKDISNHRSHRSIRSQLVFGNHGHFIYGR